MEIQLNENEVSCTLEEAGSNSFDLRIRVGQDVIRRELKRSFEHLKGQVEVPGFRKGNAPEDVIKKKFGDRVKEDLQKRLLEKSLRIAVEEEDLEIVGEPEVTEHPGELSEQEAFEYAVNVETKPEVEVGNYEEIEVERPDVEVTSEEVEEAIENAREEHAELTWVEDGSIQDGDVIIADVDLQVDGNEVASEENLELTMDETLQLANLSHPDLRTHFQGLQTEETHNVELTLPDDEKLHPPKFRGSHAEVELVIHEIKRPELPEVDEEFANRFDSDSVEELREDVREQLRNHKEKQAEEELHDEILDRLIDRADFEIPERMLEQSQEHFMQRQKDRMAQAGIPEQVIREQLQEHRDESMESIEQSMKRNYVVDAVAEREKIYVTEGEVEEYIEQLASEQGRWSHELKEELEENDQMGQVRSDLKKQKVMDFLLDHVSFQEEEDE